MNKRLIAVIVAGLFAPATSWAADEDDFVWRGSVEVGARGVNTDAATRNGARSISATAATPFTGPEDGAKAQEYQDLNSGAIGVIDVRGSSRNYYLKFFGENLGRDDQYINVLGGGYDVFKAQLYSDRIPHNLSWNALTPLANTGSALQVGPGGAYPPAQNPATWNTFNYGTQRNTAGGNVEVSNRSPFFIRADYNEVLTTGVRPGSAQLGTGSGNGAIELGIPVDYKTQNTLVDLGYTAQTWNAKLGYLWSKFSNGGEPVQWTNFYMLSGLDTTLLPQNNDLKKWSFNASARDLPLDSTLVMRFTQSTLTSSFGVPGSSLKPTGNQAPPIGVGYLVTAPSSSTFDGEHKTTSAAIALASTLAKGLDSRLYYNYYDKSNESTPISYAGGGLGTGAATCPGSNSATRFCIAPLTAPEPFGYTKNEVGLDLTWRIDRAQKLMGGYNYLKVDRALESATQTEDNRLWIEYKNTMIENVSARLKYYYLEQRSDIDHLFTNSGPAAPNTVPYFFSAYDVANYDQNQFRLWVDWTPMEMLDVGFGATWRKTDYKDLLYYGRTDDKRQLYDLTISYGSADTFRINAIGNYGYVEFNQAYRQVSSGSSAVPGDPQNSTNFDWGTKNTQTNWLYAIEADWAATDKLRVKASATYQKTGGGVDFWSGNTAGAGGFNGGPLVNYVTDNTRTQRFMIKADYTIDRKWSASVGYAYENYDYTDDQMRSFQSYYGYYQNLGGTNNSWNSGAFTNPTYTNNIFFITGTYRFN